MKTLASSGYEAYLVGGCVRDMIMKRPVHDHDIATNALPNEMIHIFSGFRVIPTGIEHGTVTVICNDEPIEVTTYRIDGDYSDGRHPDCVKFTSEIAGDLSRRDFTMNAIAMSADGKIIDPFGGCEDIKHKRIRCVGEPDKRFAEDALRIMRCLRFASTLGFDIDKAAAESVHSLKNTLSLVSRERICSELNKLICGKNAMAVLLDYSDVISEIIPEIKPCIGFCQHSPYHKYDVWEHTVRALSSASEKNFTVRLALLLHDIGKPSCFSLDENGRGHFKFHGKVGAEIAKAVLKRLRCDNKTINCVYLLILHHSDKLHSETDIKHAVSTLGFELFNMLLDVKEADNSAKHSFVLSEVEEIRQMRSIANDIMARGECLKTSQLAVSGKDLMQLGFGGREIGKMLKALLDMVIDGKISNDKESLTEFAVGRKEKETKI